LANPNQLPDFFSTQEKPFELKAFLYHYVLRYWYLYLLFPAGAYFGAWLYLRYAVPVYEVKCSLLIKDERKGSGLSETALLQELGAIQETKNIENELQILKSQTLMEEVVRELNLNLKYFAVGRVKNEEMYRNSYVRLDSFKLNQGESATLDIQCLDSLHFESMEGENRSRHAFGQWFSTERGMFRITRNAAYPVLDQGHLIVQIQSTENIARAYLQDLFVKPMSYYSSVLEIKLREPIARRAADVLNKLVEVYNRAAVEDKNKVSENTIKFIDQRLLYLTEELSTVEGGVQQYKQRNQIATNIESGIDIVLEEMSQFEAEIARLEVQRSVLQNMETYLSNMGPGSYQLVPANLGTGDEGLAQLIVRFNEKVLDRDRLAQTANAANPALLRLQQELQSLHANVLETIRKVEKRTETTLGIARNKRGALTGKVREVPRMERELQEIMRQQSIKQNLYLFLLQKREETLLALASTTANSRVVDPARPNKIPVTPQKRLVYLLAVLFGLSLPALFILLKDLLNDTVQGENDLKKASNSPLLGGILLSRSGKDIVVSTQSRSAVAEMFRLLRTNIQFLLPPTQDKGQTILVTSSASGDGKTFVTANLGMALAISGKKTLLIELDLRKPKLARYLQAATGEKGLTNYLLGQTSLENIVQASDLHEELFYIPSGPIPPNPAELLLYPALDQLFTALKADFDFILIDTSPVGLVADALLLNRFATASLYVVRQGQTQKGMLKTLRDIEQEQKLNRLAVVLNGVKEGRGNGYGYGGYGYGYGYGYYEAEKTQVSGFWNRLVKRLKR
jgi:capsular exopolysaccharide synthesis family protein